MGRIASGASTRYAQFMPPDGLAFPFLTRKMLNYEPGTVFSLQVNVYSFLTDTVWIIGSTREGIFKQKLNHSGNGTEETTVYELADIPTFVTMFTDSANLARGDMWVSMFLLANGERVYKLASGYVSKQSALNWPIVQSESELSNGGGYRHLTGINPAAGSECLDPIPSNQHWRLIGMRVTLVTSATVANRRVHLYTELNDGATGVEFFGVTDQPASTTYTYNFFHGVSNMAEFNNNVVQIGIPDHLHLMEGANIGTLTTNLQVGDNYGAPTYIYERFIED